MKKLARFVFFSFIAVSCLNEPDCYQLNNDVVGLYFKVLGFGSDLVVVNSVQSPASLPGFFYGDTAITEIGLPLNPINKETIFIFEGQENDSRNLHLGYNRQVQFVSSDCGERYVFSDLKILENDFDSVRIVNSSPTSPASRNIEIYRCAVTNQMGLSFESETHVEGITADFPADISLPSTELTTIILPINKDNSTTTFVFDFGDVSKTLKVKYSRTSETFGKVCGTQTIFSDLVVDSTDFTSATVDDEEIKDLPVINIEATK